MYALFWFDDFGLHVMKTVRMYTPKLFDHKAFIMSILVILYMGIFKLWEDIFENTKDRHCKSQQITNHYIHDTEN